MVTVWVQWYTKWSQLQQNSPSKVTVVSLEALMDNPRRILRHIAAFNAEADGGTQCFVEAHDQAIRELAAGLTVKHSASNTWADGVAGMQNVTKFAVGGQSFVTPNKVLQALADMHMGTGDANSKEAHAGLASAVGMKLASSPEAMSLCARFNYLA